MTPLINLPGLGPKSLAMLAAAGIASAERLHQMGAVDAYLQVRRAGQPATLNLLWALEGAITRQRWQTVAREERTRLLLALDAAEHPPAP